MIRSIAHDQHQKNFKYLWLDFGYFDLADLAQYRFLILDCRIDRIKSEDEIFCSFV
jgi:hypothetical protein